MSMEWITGVDDFVALSGPMGSILIAALLGAAVGVEREYRGKTAGIKTNMLITMGACLVMIVSRKSAGIDPHTGIPLWDPSRIAAQVVSGIGFLGAGTIIHSRHLVKGLTTAATLWLLAGVGLAVGANYTVYGVATTLIVLLALTALRPLEDSLVHRGHRTCQVELTFDNNSDVMAGLTRLVGAYKLKEHSFRIRRHGNRMTLQFTYTGRTARVYALQEHLAALEGVDSLEIEVEG